MVCFQCRFEFFVLSGFMFGMWQYTPNLHSFMSSFRWGNGRLLLLCTCHRPSREGGPWDYWGEISWNWRRAPSTGVFLVFWAFFLPEDWGHFQASVGGCHCHPLSHCLSDLPRVETLLSDHARRLGELSNFNVKSCDSSRYPRVPPSQESRWQVHYGFGLIKRWKHSFMYCVLTIHESWPDVKTLGYILNGLWFSSSVRSYSVVKLWIFGFSILALRE